MVWGSGELFSLIDWEFCGIKAEVYDAALLVGCIGFENPAALTGDFTLRLINRLRDSGIYKKASWDVFFDLLIASRYGWLSSWMRKNDERSRDLEMLYMNLLTARKKHILEQWGF